MRKKIGLISLGCSKNLVDSENMLGLLERKGYKITDNIAEANAIIVNTCAFIDSAKQESIDAILDAARYKKEGKCKALICAGCLAERYKDEIMAELPELDGVVGVNDFNKIVSLVDKTLHGEKMQLFGGKGELKAMPRMLATPGYTAYIKIAEGCDNFCSYCAIPKIRGRYKSRGESSIMKEARRLTNSGVKEIILVAQDTSRYGLDKYGEKKLPELMRKLCTIEKLEWLRVHYCYPEEIDDDLISAVRDEPKILKYLDIPIQHCNDRILKKMNRKTTGDDIRALIKRLREEIPDVVIRTSLITGFPGETEEEFEELCEFVKEMKFDRLGVFPYSAEEGTPAAGMEGQIDEDVKKKRADKIMEIQKEVAAELGEKNIGRVLQVLTEGFDNENYLYYGRSYMDSLDVDAKVYFGARSYFSPGEFANVKIMDYADYDLIGEMTYE